MVLTSWPFFSVPGAETHLNVYFSISLPGVYSCEGNAKSSFMSCTFCHKNKAHWQRTTWTDLAIPRNTLLVIHGKVLTKHFLVSGPFQGETQCLLAIGGNFGMRSSCLFLATILWGRCRDGHLYCIDEETEVRRSEIASPRSHGW